MGLSKCGRVQIESYKKSQNFVVKVKKKINMMTFELKSIEHMHLIMGNYLMKSFFIILS